MLAVTRQRGSLCFSGEASRPLRLCLYAKRLEKAQFCWPRIDTAGSNSITPGSWLWSTEWTGSGFASRLSDRRDRWVKSLRRSGVRGLKLRRITAKYALIKLMTRPDIELSDDVEALKAMVVAMAEKASGVRCSWKSGSMTWRPRNADAS